MATMSSWFWLAFVDLGFFVAGLSVLWFFARRALRDQVDDERALRALSRTMMQVLEYRLERLLLNPPSWASIARKVRPYLVGVLGVTVGGLILWGIWTLAGNWFAEAPAPRQLPSSNGPGLPWESAFDEVHNAISGPIAVSVGLIGLVGGLSAVVLGAPRRASPFIAVALAVLLMSRASAFVTALYERDPSVSSAQRVGQPAQPTAPNSAELATRADEAEEEAVEEQGESMPQLEAASAVEVSDESTASLEAGEMPLETTATHHQVSSDKQSHFGFGDALMMYGAYKLLTHEGAPRSTVGAAPQNTAPPSAATHTQVLAPRHGVSTPPQPKARVRSVYRTTRTRRSR